MNTAEIVIISLTVSALFYNIIFDDELFSKAVKLGIIAAVIS